MAGERWIGLEKEATYGAGKVSHPEQSLAIIELDAQPDQQRDIEAESAYRQANISTLGPFLGTGRLTHYARPDRLGRLLHWVTGKTVVSTQQDTGTMYKHDFAVDNALTTLDSFVIGDHRGLTGLDARYLNGCAIKSLTLEAAARAKVICETEFIYNWEELDTASTMGTLSALRPFIFYDGTIELPNAIALANVESFRFKIENGMPDDSHNCGSRKLPGMELEGVKMTIEADLKFKTWALRQKFYGATIAGPAEPKEPQTEDRTFSAEITLTGEPSGDAAAANYKLVILLNKVVPIENPSNVVRRDRLTERVTLEALYHASDVINLYNKDTAYS